MATPEELETLASSLLADMQQLGRDVHALGDGVVEVRAAIVQAGEDLQAEIADFEDDCAQVLDEASTSLRAMFEMAQALGTQAADGYAEELAAMIEGLQQAHADTETALEEAARLCDERVSEVAAGAQALRAVVEEVAAEASELATRSGEALEAMREAIEAGNAAAEERLSTHAASVDGWLQTVDAEQGEFRSHLDGQTLPAIDEAMQALSVQLRETSEQIVVAGIDATRSEALEVFDAGIKSVVDQAVEELLRLMNQLSDEILDKAEGPRGQTEALREVVDLLQGLIEPLLDRIGSVRGLAASVGVNV